MTTKRARKDLRRVSYADFRDGPKRKMPLPRLFRGEARRNVLDQIVDVLSEYRSSPFEHEGAMRHGLRSALCLKGEPWPRADLEAHLLIAEGLRVAAPERPSWAEGQWHYTVPREHCAWCYSPITDADATSGQRFCSVMCAKSALEHRVYETRKNSDAIALSAQRLILKKESALRPCAVCGTMFQSHRGVTIHCSPRCSRAAKGDLIPDRDCTICGARFHPKGESYYTCSKVCGGISAAATLRATLYPETSCACCKTVFRPTWPSAIYCSKACGKRMGSRAYKARERAKRNVSNVVYLTPKVFDDLFAQAA